MPRITCTVNNCHYWSKGNFCEASEILVTSDRFANQQPDSVDALQAADLSPTPAESCMATCCKTFVEKNSHQIRADGITKNPY